MQMSKLPVNLGSFSKSIRELWQRTDPCTLCPRNCKAHRSKGQTGFCGITDTPKVSSVGPHFGEEPMLVGPGGSGTIFFAGCNLGCIYCQNFDISHLRQGREFSIEQLADSMLSLQKQGCSNINLVTPTHVVAAIATAIESARNKGLSLPIVYNTGGYDSVGTLEFLTGFVDIYMPDTKYADSETAKRLSAADDYPQVNRAALKQMHRQVGDLKIENGLAVRGLLVRHLILPNQLAGSFKTIDFLAEEISRSTAINIMDQYRPCYKADLYLPLNRYPRAEEITQVCEYAIEKGLNVMS